MNIVYFLIALNVLLLVLIFRLSFTISKIPAQLQRLQLLISRGGPGPEQLLGSQWISNRASCPAIERVESKTIYFEDGVVAPEPARQNDSFVVIFGDRKLWYESLAAATLSSYTIAESNKCTATGLVDVQSV